MRVLVAGASGVIGQRLVRLLAAAGHVVTGTTRSPERAAAIRAAGATPVVVNVFDAQQLGDAVASARPVVVVHQLTDLPDRLDPTSVADTLARNARVRTEGTCNLVAAAVRAGTRRLVAQSIAWAYAPGAEPHREDDPLDADAEGIRRVTVSGVAELERLVTSVPRLEGLVLRYGQLYGPGTWERRPIRQRAGTRGRSRPCCRAGRRPRRPGRLQHRGGRRYRVECKGARPARLGPGSQMISPIARRLSAARPLTTTRRRRRIPALGAAIPVPCPPLLGSGLSRFGPAT